MDARLMSLVYAATLALVAGGAGFLASANADPPLDADAIARAAGSKATTTKDGIVRIAWARTDVSVTVDGMPLKPFAGLLLGRVRRGAPRRHADG
jgi:hypothetical protein